MSDLDKKLEQLLKALVFDEWHDDGYLPSYKKAIKQAFRDAGWQEPWDGATRVKSFELNEGRVYMLGQEFYERFEKELWHPPKQELPEQNDEGESHDRFHRIGGQLFMYARAIEAAKKAAGLRDDTTVIGLASPGDLEATVDANPPKN